MDSSSPTWWWIEQTILSALFENMGARVLPLDHYVVSLKRQWPFEQDVDYSKICAGILFLPVRHLMYKTGIRCFSRRAVENGSIGAPLRVSVDSKWGQEEAGHQTRCDLTSPALKSARH